MRDIPNQKEMWNRKHGANEHALTSDIINEFAINTESGLSPGSSILELGCGVGRDARYFAKKGHTVLATDLSEVVIEQNKERPPIAGLTYQYLDFKDLRQYADNSYDMVYAYLSLHYFDNDTTVSIFNEIRRIIKPIGIIAFACKTTDDKYFGLGDKVGDDMFLYKGHVRHFFSEEYTRELMNKCGYKIVELHTSRSKIYHDTTASAIITCIAKKI